MLPNTRNPLPAPRAQSLRVSALEKMMSRKQAHLHDLVERYRTNPELLTPKDLYDVRVALGEHDPDSDIEADIEKLVKSVTTKEQMLVLYHQYSDPSWIPQNTPLFVMSMCAALRALSSKFGLPDLSLWKSYDLTAEVD
jgi:hypothetical protein